MEPAKSRITQIQQLVELIRSESAGLDPLPRRAAERDPYSRHEPEGPLADRLAEIWPEQWPGIASGPGLVDYRAARLAALESLEELGAALEEKVSDIKSLGARLARRRQRAAHRVAEAEQAAQAARDLALDLSRRARQSREMALKQREKARRLADWIKGVRPQGLSRFRDAQGRVFGLDKLEEINRRRVKAVAECQRADLVTRDAWQKAKKAQEGADRVAGDLATARQARQVVLRGIKDKSRDLRSKAGEIKELRARSRHLRQQAAGLERLAGHHARLVRRAAAWLREEEAAVPAAVVPGDTLAQAEQSGREATCLGRNALRMAALVQRQEKILAGWQERCAKLGHRTLRLNREIKKIDKDLPGMLAPLVEQDYSDSRSRAKSLGDLATLRARLEELRPQAAALAGQYEGLCYRQDTALDRAKRLTEAWRAAGRAERAAQSQAQALLAEAEYAGRAMNLDADALVQRTAPWVETCLALAPPELAMPVKELIRGLAGRRETARQTAQACATCQDGLGALLVTNLSRTPARLKPYGNTLRRQRGRSLDIERLEGLWRVAEYWHGLLVGDMAERIRQPLRRENLALSKRLAELDAEHQELREHADRLDNRLRRSQVERERAMDTIARLEKVSQAHEKLVADSNRLEQELASYRRDHAQALDTIGQLEKEAVRAEVLAHKLDHESRLSQALRQKSLERHQLYRQSEKQRLELAGWQEEANQRAKKLAATERRLAWTKAELDRLRLERVEALGEAGLLENVPEAGQSMAERRARPAGVGSSLSAELSAARQEAWRWSRLAGDLSAALAVLSSQHRGQTKELTQEVYELRHEASELQQELDTLRVLLVAALSFQADRLPKPDGLTLSPEQVERLLKRLAVARRKLADLGRSTVGQLSLIAALTAGLVLGNPQPPSKATLLEANPRLERPALYQTMHTGRMDLAQDAPLTMSAVGMPLHRLIGRADLKVDLAPQRYESEKPPAKVARRVERVAAGEGVDPTVLMPIAGLACQQQAPLESAALQRIAATARGLADSHPVIKHELEQRGEWPRDLEQATRNSRQGRYLDKLYTEYRTLGFSPQQALGALAAAEEATLSLKQQWKPPNKFKGKVRPLETMEDMDLATFVRRMAPFIADRAGRFLRSRGADFTGDMAEYSRELAHDMYCAADKFDLPVSVLFAIAHQETWYANVLGDQNRSASPFHIFNPTKLLILDSMARAGYLPPPRTISLERHLTMATYMAAFHLRELMQESWVPSGKGGGYVDMNQVMKRYNGSSAYAGRVAKRQREQVAYLKKIRPNKSLASQDLTARISIPNL